MQLHEQKLVYWGALAFGCEPSVEGAFDRDWPVPIRCVTLCDIICHLVMLCPQLPPGHELRWLLPLLENDHPHPR